MIQLKLGNSDVLMEKIGQQSVMKVWKMMKENQEIVEPIIITYFINAEVSRKETCLSVQYYSKNLQ